MISPSVFKLNSSLKDSKEFCRPPPPNYSLRSLGLQAQAAFFAGASAQSLNYLAIVLNGLIANLVEYPAVARGKARFRFQVMASHTDEQLDRGVRIFRHALAQARQRLGE